MNYVILIHFALNLTVLFWYLQGKTEYKKIYKEIITTVLIGWLIVMFAKEDQI